MKKIVVVGSINMDLVISADNMPKKGETVHGSGFFLSSGGKGANQAVAAAKMEAETILVGCVGNDFFGKELILTLQSYGVKTMVNTADINTGVAVIIIENTDNRIVLDGGANKHITPAIIDQALDTCKKGDILLCQMEINADATQYALAKARQKGMITIFNPAPAYNVIESILRSTDIIILNESECLTMTNIYPDCEKAYVNVYNYFLSYGIKKVIITLGEKGSVLIDNEGVFFCKALEVDEVDTTAAGDAYIGALAAQMLRGDSIRQAMEWATKVSAVVVTRRGAQSSIPMRKEII